MNLNRDIYKLSNYQSGLLYEVKSGYFKSIHDYLSKNDKDIEFEKLLLFNSISSLNINACKILLNNNRYDKKIFDKEFYYNLFLKEDLDFLKTFFKIDFIKENINEGYVKDFYILLEEDTNLFIENFFKSKKIKKSVEKF